MTARIHAAAVLSLLNASGATFYDGEVPTGVTGRYGVLYVTTPRGVTERLSADQSVQSLLVTILHVGDSPNECRWVVEKAQAALVRVRPTVAGRSCTPLKLGTNGQVREDTTTSPYAWVATDVYSFGSTPA